MSILSRIRAQLRRRIAGTDEIVLEAGDPDLGRALEGIGELGLDVHVPFCRRLCPYCPYNRTLLRADLAARYVDAVRREIDRRAEHVGDRRVTTPDVGGGTPTTLVDRGLDRILGHVFGRST